MIKQFSYSFRQNLHPRLWALGVCVALNLVFAIFGLLNLYSTGWKIVAIVFSALSLTAVLGVAVVSDIEGIRTLFTAPAGYLTHLTPVPRWKILLGRLCSMAIWDVVSVGIGVCGVVLQSFIFADILGSIQVREGDTAAFFILMGFLHYLFALCALAFGIALGKSVFYARRGRSFLAVISICLVLYLLSLFDFILIPFGSYYQYGMFGMVTLIVQPSIGIAVYLLLLLLRSAALFVATSRLMERRVNL